MVSAMENNDPITDPDEARASLADIDGAEHAVRDVPWPIWLYLVNAALLAMLTVAVSLDDRRTAAITAIALTMIAANYLAARALNIPWAIPSSRVFIGALSVCIVVAVGALMLADVVDTLWPFIALAAGNAVIYLIGCFHHHRTATR